MGQHFGAQSTTARSAKGHSRLGLPTRAGRRSARGPTRTPASPTARASGRRRGLPSYARTRGKPAPPPGWQGASRRTVLRGVSSSSASAPDRGGVSSVAPALSAGSPECCIALESGDLRRATLADLVAEMAARRAGGASTDNARLSGDKEWCLPLVARDRRLTPVPARRARQTGNS